MSKIHHVKGDIVEFSKVEEFIASATHNGYRIVKFDHDDEDPIAHYYALERQEEVTVGYFGYEHGADNNHGFIARSPQAYFLQLN